MPSAHAPLALHASTARRSRSYAARASVLVRAAAVLQIDSLPLHFAAASMASEAVVRRLLAAYPEGKTHKAYYEGRGYTPMDSAEESGASDAVKALLR